MEKIGYARVSTIGQSLDFQIEQLRGQGCTRIFQEKISGGKSDRPQLALLLSSLQPGDTLVVTRLDRLARSTSDLLTIIQATAKKQANFLSLAEPWANTSTAIGKLMLTVLGGIAEFERDLIALRTSEGRERAKKSGIKFGPKFKLSPHQMDEIKRRKQLGESCRFLARSYNVSPNTISRIKVAF
jgi:DNA invertase Pin-like site-specific DNA recombinase